jgi:hypothetical protein
MSIDEAIEAYTDIFGLEAEVIPDAPVTEPKEKTGFLRRSRLFGKSKASAAPETSVQQPPPKATGSLLGPERFDEKIANAVRNRQRLTQQLGRPTSSTRGLS